MHNLPVHWSEGMFLQPHHLQAADRYWTEVFQITSEVDHPYAYGVRRLEFSGDALGNYQFEVKACQARLRDGTLISLAPGQQPDRVDLKAAFSRENVVRVFLAAPKLKMGRANVAVQKKADQQRYTESIQGVQDESVGGNEQEVRFRDMNVCLMLSTQDTAGYELLPIAQIQRAGEKESSPQIDLSYIPPLLAVDAWQYLALDIIRAIYDRICKKIDILSQQVINRGITLASQEPGDLDRLLMLSALNVAQGTLRVFTFANGVHPFTAYVELCRIAGALAVFSKERRLPEIPLYDHDELGRIFHYLRDLLATLLESIRDYEYEQRWFEGEGRGMRVVLESKWLEADWQWFVGVQRGPLPERECLNILAPGTLNWKLGSSRQVEEIFRYRKQALQLEPLAQAPRALPPSREWTYFEVTRGNEAWRDILETQTLAMRFAERHIANLDTLAGSRKLSVTLGGKQHVLQFALFAVPTRQQMSP